MLLSGDPRCENTVATILRYCSEYGTAIMSFGGGTNGVKELDPFCGAFDAVVSSDLRRFNQFLTLNEVPDTAELGTGVTGPEAERLLGEHNFSLGHFPQSFSSPPSETSRRPGRPGRTQLDMPWLARWTRAACPNRPRLPICNNY